MKEKIEKALQHAMFPGFDKDIMSLGMVDAFTVEGDSVRIKMKPLQATDEVKLALTKNIEDALIPLNLKAIVEMGGNQQPKEAQLPPKQPIPNVKHIVPVASGKGGVGKSTTAVNLAIALANQGHKTGLLDLDVYGPSIPTMMGIDTQLDATEDGKMEPVEKYGVKTISIGFLMERDKPLIWRGPMVGRIVKQFFYDVNWGELDYLVLDLPPGTGDVQITLIQSLPLHGAVIVTTPQNVALADASKAIAMFNQTDAPVIGVVENMSGFVCPHCGQESVIFGKGGADAEAKRKGVEIIGRIPLEGKITATGDSGVPIATGEGAIADAYAELAKKVVSYKPV